MRCARFRGNESTCRIWLDSKSLAHRIGGPAKEWNDGSKSWWIRGKALYSDHQSSEGNSSAPWIIEPTTGHADPCKKKFSFPGYREA